jgi:hypothetical protein
VTAKYSSATDLSAIRAYTRVIRIDRCLAAVMDLVACHRCDAGQSLAVEPHEAAGDAIDAGDAGVM